METAREDSRYIWLSVLLFSLTFLLCRYCLVPA